MLADLFCVGLANPWEASLGSGRGNRFRSTTGLPGDLLVFRASGSVRVFVDQSAQDRFSADLLCVYAGPGGGEPPGEPLRADLARPGAGAELGRDPAQDPAVGPAGAGLLGAAQGGQVGLGGLAEGDVTGGRGQAADRSPCPGRYQR